MGKVEAHYDKELRIVRCRLAGFFSLSELEEYRVKLTDAMATARRYSASVRVLFDGTESVVQTPEVVAGMREISFASRRPEDRIAILVASNLIKIQAERSLNADNEKVFMSHDEAMRWLEES